MDDIILTPNQQVPRGTRLRLFSDAGDGTYVPLVASAIAPGSLDGLTAQLDGLTAQLDRLRPPTTPDILHAEIAADATEYSVDFSLVTVRRLVITNRNANAFRLAFVEGYVAAALEPHLEIPAGAAYDSGSVNWTGAIYFAGTAGDDLQFEYWI